MKPYGGPTEASECYSAAHRAQYAAKDLHEALKLYMCVIAGHPDTNEAEYSRTQIQNIVNSVVPRHELLEVQVDLAFAYMEPSN